MKGCNIEIGRSDDHVLMDIMIDGEDRRDRCIVALRLTSTEIKALCAALSIFAALEESEENFDVCLRGMSAEYADR